VVVPQFEPYRSGNVIGTDSDPLLTHPDFVDPSDSACGNLAERATLLSLKELVASVDQRLDLTLAAITEAARKMTGASGSALAMWKDGDMVCRARSGEMAPLLGARLSAETGISGECFRTGQIQNCSDTENNPLVDLEVCRGLGLRSIVVLPIQGWRGVNGILEVFSTRPAAFAPQHIVFLQQLAAMAERARASQPHSASSAPPKTSPEKSPSSGLLPASDTVGDVALAFVGPRSRPFVMGVIGLAAISLLAFVVWLGWRGPDDTDGKAHAATTSSVAAANAAPDKQAPDNDPVWRANPGGETVGPSGKPSAGAPVKLASEMDVLIGKKPSTHRFPLLGGIAADLATRHETKNTQTGLGSIVPASEAVATKTATDPLSVPSVAVAAANLREMPSLGAPSPQLAIPTSQGVSGGELVRRVTPIYPALARAQRLEGTVVLSAIVLEDGTVSDVKVVEGSLLLAQAAIDAVQQWRYKPFELDGKSVKNDIRINVDFKFPSQ
jgi:TonB family protein